MDQIKQLLELMDHPAIWVVRGQISAANTAALHRQFLPGMEVEPLLTSGAEEYREFVCGCLSLSVQCCTERYTATVTALDQGHIFTLDPVNADAELHTLSLAAQELREPLGNALALLEELQGDADICARLNKSLHQLLRIVGNMSDQPLPRLELLDVNSLLLELWEKVKPACDARSVELVFRSHPQPIYTCADSDLLTRAIHNLLSNALKYTESGGKVHLACTMRNHIYRISLHSSGMIVGPLQNPFARYRREPGLEDGRSGLGLGLKIVQSAALSHGGAVLLDTPSEGGVRVTLSMPLRQNTAGLRSSRYRISYSGERDPMLIELSDVLPPEFYRK